jgi:hypothetical protein
LGAARARSARSVPEWLATLSRDAPGGSFPASATNAVLPLRQDQGIRLTNWPAGKFFAHWYDPLDARFVGRTEGASVNNSLLLPLPDFREDLVGVVFCAPALKSATLKSSGLYEFLLESQTGAACLIEHSGDLLSWSTYLRVTNTEGTSVVRCPWSPTNSGAYFRARLEN